MSKSKSNRKALANRVALISAAAPLATLSASSSLHAATIDWKSSGGTTVFTASNAWVGDVAPVNNLTTDIGRFNQSGYSNSPQLPAVTVREINGLEFGNGTSAVAGLTLSGTSGSAVTTVSGSGSTISFSSPPTGFTVGMLVTGTGIAAGSTIVSISGNDVVLSSPLLSTFVPATAVTPSSVLRIGSSGVSMKALAGASTISVPLVLATNQSISNDSTNLLTVSGSIALGQGGGAGNTLTLSGSGNTLLSGGLGTPSGGGIVKNGTGTVLLTATSTFPSHSAGVNDFSLTANQGVYQINTSAAMPNSVTMNGGMIRTSSGNWDNHTGHSVLNIGANGGFVDISIAGSTNSPNVGTTGGFTGGTNSSSGAVTVVKTGLGIWNGVTQAVGTLNVKPSVYSGQWTVGADKDVNNGYKVWGLELVGGSFKATSAAQYQTAGSNLTGKVRVQSTGIGIGTYQVLSNSQTSADLTSDSRGGAWSVEFSGATLPNFATVGDGKMWLAGNQTITAAVNPNSDATYRLLGNTFSVANTFSGNNAMKIGAGAMVNGNATVSFSANQNFTGALTIAGNNIGEQANPYTKTVLNLTGTAALSTQNITVNQSATLSINPSAAQTTPVAHLAANATVNLNGGMVQLNPAANTPINETISTLGVQGAAVVKYNNVGTGSANQLTAGTINFTNGGMLNIQAVTANAAAVGGANAADPKLLFSSMNVNGNSVTLSSGQFLPQFRVGTASNQGNNWVKYNGTGTQAFAAGDYSVDLAEGSWTSSSNVDFNAGGATLTNNRSVQSIRFAGAAQRTVTATGFTLNVTGGGIMGSALGGNGTGIITGGSLTTSASNLYLWAQGSLGIASQLTGNFNVIINGNTGSAAVSLSNATNNFVGDIYVNGGNNTFSADGVLGHANNVLHYNGGIFATHSVTFNHTLDVMDGGIQIATQNASPTVFNGKVTGSGPIQVGFPDQVSTLTLGNSTNDFTGLIYTDHRNGNLTGTSIRTSAANVMGNNAALMLSGGTTLDTTNGGAIAAGSSQSLGSLEGAGNVLLGTGTSNVLTVGGRNVDSAYVGTISGAGGITKTGTASFVLANTQLYTGTTTVSNGTLRLTSAGGAYNSATNHGNISKSALIDVGVGSTLDVSAYDGKATEFTVGATGVASQTLNGKGTIVGNMTIGSQGTLAPGNSVGTLTQTGNLTLASGSTSNFELTGNAASNTYDKYLFTSGAITYGGTLNVTVLATTPTAAGTYTLFSGFSGQSGDFSAINLPTITGFVWHDYDAGAGVDYFNNGTGQIQLDSAVTAANNFSLTFGAGATTGTQGGANLNDRGDVVTAGSNGSYETTAIFDDGTSQNKGYVDITGSLPTGTPIAPVYVLVDFNGLADQAAINAFVNTLTAASGSEALLAISTDTQGTDQLLFDQLTSAYAGAGRTWDALLQFNNTTGAGAGALDLSWNFGIDTGVTVDKIAVVPEPASLSLVGLAGLATLHSRRRRKMDR